MPFPSKGAGLAYNFIEKRQMIYVGYTILKSSST